MLQPTQIDILVCSRSLDPKRIWTEPAPAASLPGWVRNSVPPNRRRQMTLDSSVLRPNKDGPGTNRRRPTGVVSWVESKAVKLFSLQSKICYFSRTVGGIRLVQLRSSNAMTYATRRCAAVPTSEGASLRWWSFADIDKTSASSAVSS